MKKFQNIEISNTVSRKEFRKCMQYAYAKDPTDESLKEEFMSLVGKGQMSAGSEYLPTEDAAWECGEKYDICVEPDGTVFVTGTFVECDEVNEDDECLEYVYGNWHDEAIDDCIIHAIKEIADLPMDEE